MFKFEGYIFVFNVVHEVVVRNVTHPHVLSNYNTMVMVALRLFWLNISNGVMLALDYQAVRLY